MTEIDINTAIANALGWSHVRFDYQKACSLSRTIGLGIVGISPTNNQNGLNDPDRDSWIVPDYLNDLNAMHGAEKVLVDGQFAAYCAYLVRDRAWFVAVNATAKQRAEAFLKTIGKWEESA